MTNRDAKSGVLFALAAYTMWGLAPMYFKLLAAVPAAEVLVQRVVWSVVLLLLLVFFMKQLPKVINAFASPKVLLVLACSGLLLGGNWFVFIWSVNNDRLLDSSLGYYINPLVNMLLGRLFLGERLLGAQKVAVSLAVLGVLIVVLSFGEVPWIALTLAFSFGIYGLLRKTVDVESIPGLLVESLLMLPIAVVYWVWFAGPSSNLIDNDAANNLLFVCAGIVTTAPLLCFTAAARRIQLTTLGFFQYIGPSFIFLLAVYYYGEPLDLAKLVAFGFVWLALVIFSIDSYRRYRQQ